VDTFEPNEEKINEATRLLPAWFVSRMMTDDWTFGLLLSTGQVMVVNYISEVHQAADGSIWIDVKMGEKAEWHEPELGNTPSGMSYLSTPTKRDTASVNAAHVVAAFELAST